MIDVNERIYDIVKQNPEALEFLISNGFDNLEDDNMLESFGKKINLGTALRAKGINKDLFMQNLDAFLQSKEEYNISKDNLLIDYDSYNDVYIQGLLPCPIRIPLGDTINDYIKSENRDFKIITDLEPASVGIDEIARSLNGKNEAEYPDIITSAGFEFFFGKRMQKLVEKGIYTKSNYEIHNEFAQKNADLKDPKNIYHIMGVVPAVFIVNTALLGDRKVPNSWEDILSGEFENTVSIPMQDLDLFNAIVLTIYSKFGLDGIERLKKAFHKNLHPSQMVKSGKNEAVISIAPYFFTTMLQDKNSVGVWPSDGAILSPIFMIANYNKPNVVKVADALNSEKIGEIFSFGGNFPSTNPKVDNHLKENMKYMWAGWDFIYKNDIEKLIKDFTMLFENL